MNKQQTYYRYFFIITVLIILVAFTYSPSISGPGDTDDPVVSLSYLQMAGKFGEVPLRKNDEYPLDKGTTFIVFEGDTEIRGVGDYTLIDLTSGKSFKRGKDLNSNHLYLVVGGNDVKIVAKKDSIILIRGGDGGPLRRAY